MGTKELVSAITALTIVLFCSPCFAQNAAGQDVDGNCNIQIGGDAEGDVINNCNVAPVAPITISQSEMVLFSAFGQVSFDPYLDAPNYRQGSTTILNYNNPEYGAVLELRVLRQDNYLEPVIYVGDAKFEFEPPRWGVPSEVWDLGRSNEFFFVNDGGKINLRDGFTYHFSFAPGRQGAAIVGVIEGVRRNHVVAFTLPLIGRRDRYATTQRNDIDRVLVTREGDIEILANSSVVRETVVGDAFYSQ